MSANVGKTGAYFSTTGKQAKAADASDKIAYAIAGIPAADVAPGFKHMAETCTKLYLPAAEATAISWSPEGVPYCCQAPS